MEDDNRLKVLLIKDCGPWVVLCLNYDMIAQGETPKKAWEAFNWTYWTQILLDKQDGIAPLSRLKRAPDEYWKQFETGLRFAMKFELIPPLSSGENPSVAEDVRLASAA